MLLHNHPEYVSCACGYNAVNYDAKSLTTHRTTLLNFPSSPPSLSFEPVSISLGCIMNSFQTSAPLFIQDGGVSARGWRQNTPVLGHTQAAV